MNMAYLIPIIVIGVIIWACLSVRKDQDIDKNGIVADAVVSRVIEKESEVTDYRDKDFGMKMSDFTYYVRYRLPDGNEVEAKLGRDPHGVLFHGDQIRIKYMPNKPDYVLPAD